MALVPASLTFISMFSDIFAIVELYCMHYVQRTTVLYLPATSINHFSDIKLGRWEQTLKKNKTMTCKNLYV